MCGATASDTLRNWQELRAVHVSSEMKLSPLNPLLLMHPQQIQIHALLWIPLCLSHRPEPSLHRLHLSSFVIGERERTPPHPRCRSFSRGLAHPVCLSPRRFVWVSALDGAEEMEIGASVEMSRERASERQRVCDSRSNSFFMDDFQPREAQRVIQWWSCWNQRDTRVSGFLLLRYYHWSGDLEAPSVFSCEHLSLTGECCTSHSMNLKPSRPPLSWFQAWTSLKPVCSRMSWVKGHQSWNQLLDHTDWTWKSGTCLQYLLLLMKTFRCWKKTKTRPITRVLSQGKTQQPDTFAWLGAITADFSVYPWSFNSVNRAHVLRPGEKVSPGGSSG